jgi:mannosyltransferase
MESIQSRLSSTEAAGRENSFLTSAAVQYIALGVITLAALLIRFYKLGVWSLWIDEVLTINYTLEDISSFWTPNSFRLIRIALDTFGVSEWSARLMPALVGTITLPALYFPIRRYFGVAVALLAVALLAISPWHLYWSQNARQYSTLVLFYSLGVFAFFAWLETDRLRYLIAAGALMLLAAVERLNAAFFGPVVLVYFLALLIFPFGKPAGFRWRNMALLAVPVFLFAAYQVFAMGLIQDFSFWILGRQHNPIRVLMSVVYDIGLPLFITAVLGGIYLVLQRSRAGVYIFLGAIIPLLILAVIAPFTQTFSRYVFMTLPAWVILGSVAAREIWVQSHNHLRILAIGIVLVLFADAASQDILYFGYQNGNRENYKEAFALIQANQEAGDSVVTTRWEIGTFYLGQETIDSNQIDLDGLIASGQRIWFVMDNRTYISDRLQNWISINTELKGVYDVYLPGKLMTMRVYLYEPSPEGR